MITKFKIFESVTDEPEVGDLFDLNLGDYVIWQSKRENKILEILNIIEINNNNEYISINLYRYDGILYKLSKQKESWRYPSSYDNYIIYKSDNLQDCIDYINYTTDSKKYNL